MKHIVIVGGGFAGVWAAISAAETRDAISVSELSISLISDTPDICIRPKLYATATPDMMVPIEPLMREIGVEIIIDKALGISEKLVTTASQDIAFDKMIIAVGSQLAELNITGCAQFTFNVDTYAARQKLDQHLNSLNQADTIACCYVIIGAGFTGLEVATNLREQVGQGARIILVDQNGHAGASLGSSTQPYISQALDKANVEVMAGAEVSRISSDKVCFKNGYEIFTKTVILATGLVANPFTKLLPGERDKNGRIMVDRFLRLSEHSNVFVAGDAALAKTDEEHHTLMSCQHAMPMGACAGRNSVRAVAERPLVEFSRPFYATCLSLGSKDALFSHGWDRQIQNTGKEAADIKKQINDQWIYPPNPKIGRDKIFEWVRQQ